MILPKLKLLFTSLPDTKSIETQRANLRKELADLENFAQSDTLAQYEELRDFIHSNEFKQRKKDIKAQKFKDTEAFKKLQRYQQLKKHPKIKIYLKTKDSQALTEFNSIAESNELKEYQELEEYINSSEFINYKNSVKKKEFKRSEAYQKLQRYKQLKKSTTIKKYYAFKDSSRYQTYLEMKDSELANEYHELEAYVTSDEFKKTRDYMKQSPNQKYKQSEEYQQLQEYLQLKNSEDIQWYYANKDHSKFNELRRWKSTFEDTFSESQLDTQKWLTKYYWGEKMLNEPYSISTDKHYLTDGQNIQFKEGALQIVTKKEEVSGKAWHPNYGFHTKTYNYTSGIVNTGDQFKQKQGLFEAKIKFGENTPVTQGFWLVSQSILPQVNIAKYHKDKLEIGYLWGKADNKKNVKQNTLRLNSAKFTNQYIIYSLEWTSDKLIWKINEQKIATHKNPLPEEELFMLFTSGIFNGMKPENLPASMEIDWVACYQEQDT